MPFVKVAAALLAVTLAAACSGPGPLVPSAVIVPDVIKLTIGSSQEVTVYYGSVRKFTVEAGRTGSPCVEIDPFFSVANSVRVIARRACADLVYLNADIGSGRTPLIAAISVNGQ